MRLMARTKKTIEQPDLPGVDRKIGELQSLGIEYAAVRDERQQILAREIELKTQLLEAMHKHGLNKYQYKNVSIEIVTEKEKVRVRIKSEDEDGEGGKI